MDQIQLPKNVSRIEENDIFNFSCHPEVKCFTNCCRQLELALTPYDMLRLKQETKLDSSSFLDRYVIQEQEAEDAFPRFYLTMVDDGQASCVFVAETGCTVYQGRPGACRAYPMGRAAIRQADNSMTEFFVLLKEPHCDGFQEKDEQTAATYSEGQGLNGYSIFNDKVATLLQHEEIRRGMELTEKQTEYFVLALYDLDNFRKQLNEGNLPNQDHYPAKKDLCKDDEQLLLFGIEWLQGVLFNRNSSPRCDKI
jgi:uncharacterized protein